MKKRSRGYSPAQAILGLCETLIAGLDDVALLRADSAQELLRGHGLPEPSTLGRFLRRFSLGHIGQLNRALDEVFARVHPLLEREAVTFDLHATYIEHQGPVGSRQGTRGTCQGKDCWHPLCCFCRRDRRVVAREAPHRPRRRLTPEADWQPFSYRDGSEVVSFRCRPTSWRKERRFVVRRDPVATGEQLTLEAREWHYWAIVSNDQERDPDELEQWHRAKANLEDQIEEAKLGLGLDNLPCNSFHANWASLLCTLLAFNLLAWLRAAQAA